MAMPVGLTFFGLTIWGSKWLCDREPRLTPGEMELFPEMWQTWERRCYSKYIDEIQDLSLGEGETHLWHQMHHTVSQCRQRLTAKNTLQQTHDCHYKIKHMSDNCCYAEVDGTPGYNDELFNKITTRAFDRLKKVDERYH